MSSDPLLFNFVTKTPAIVNHQYFGVRIDSYPPSGKGSVAINYDLVEVTVQYSLPEVTPQ